MSGRPPLGLLARFTSAEQIVAAAKLVSAQGYRAVDAFSPFPLPELSEALRASAAGVKWCVLIGALVGALGGYLMQWYTAVHAYPFDIGGRPLHSWPAFIIVTFELAVLGGALAGFFGMLALNGLPRLNHPVFAANGFQLASRNQFFLLIESRDRKFDPKRTRELLDSLGAAEIVEVESE